MRGLSGMSILDTSDFDGYVVIVKEFAVGYFGFIDYEFKFKVRIEILICRDVGKSGSSKCT